MAPFICCFCKKLYTRNCGESFHKFPKQQEIVDKWKTALNLKSIQISDYFRVCSDHFARDCYLKRHGRRHRLRSDAVPSLLKGLVNVQTLDVRNIDDIQNKNSTEIEEKASSSLVNVQTLDLQNIDDIQNINCIKIEEKSFSVEKGRKHDHNYCKSIKISTNHILKARIVKLGHKVQNINKKCKMLTSKLLNMSRKLKRREIKLNKMSSLVQKLNSKRCIDEKVSFLNRDVTIEIVKKKRVKRIVSLA